jgi:hypothetical protein
MERKSLWISAKNYSALGNLGKSHGRLLIPCTFVGVNFACLRICVRSKPSFTELVKELKNKSAEVEPRYAKDEDLLSASKFSRSIADDAK